MNERPYTRFLILSSPRSGTHMLWTSLNRHPNIVSLAEMFNPDLTDKERYGVDTPATAILREHIFREYPAQIAAVGFALHRGGAPMGRWHEIWPELEADLALRVILLHRHDLLRRFLSYCVMRERHRTGRGDFVPEPRYYEPSVLQAEFERYESELAGFRRRFADHPILQVSYEELCRDYGRIINHIEVFLGVTPRQLRPGTQRNPPIPAERLITNFDELAAAFAPTRWAWFFRRDPPIESLVANASGKADLAYSSAPCEQIGTLGSQDVKSHTSPMPLQTPIMLPRDRKPVGQAPPPLRTESDGFVKINGRRVGAIWPHAPAPRYSLANEDLLIRDFFGDKRNGVFVDVGCSTPVAYNNTYYLERHLDWSGVAVDALQEHANAWAERRPRTRFANFIVTNRSGTIEPFYRVPAVTGLSSTKPRQSFCGQPVFYQQISAPTITLDRLLDDLGIEHFDLLNLDIEGGTPEALSAFDIGRFKPSLVCVEGGGAEEFLQEYFGKHGYRRIEAYRKFDYPNWYFTPA